MRALIFLNGQFPPIEVINNFRGKDSFLIAADGGANAMLAAKIVPDVIIGDLDSVKKKTLSYFKKKKTLVICISEQETTDFEKCLNYCKSNGYLEVIVFGAISMRPDHTLNNYSILKRFSKKLTLEIVTAEFEILFINRKISFEYRKGETISLMALPSAQNIITKGLEFPLKNESLQFGVREGTLNRSVSENISISFKKGSLLLFKKHFI
ncbi:MAG: thiamine diphosphokinase [bacterium]